MGVVNELIKYYKSKYSVVLIVGAMGVGNIGFVAMLMFIVFMTTKSIIIARSIGITYFVILTTITLFHYGFLIGSLYLV